MCKTKAEFYIKVELEDKNFCDGCPCESFGGDDLYCSLYPDKKGWSRPQSCKANDLGEGVVEFYCDQTPDPKAKPEKFDIDYHIRGRTLE